MLSLALAATLLFQPQDWVVYEGVTGPGKGKHVVFLAGDEEYRSEEGLPQLARILAFRHGFKCTVLFSIDAKGEIDPNTRDSQPGMEALDTADLCVMLLRFRAWPDAQMKHFVDYYLAGKPILAMRTSTHAFNYPADSASPYARFGWRSAEWPGGFGLNVLGETWVSHWGEHGRQATRGIVANAHPLLNGVEEIFVTSDVYEAKPRPGATVQVHGQVVDGMSPSDPPATNVKRNAAGEERPVNAPLTPVAWTLEPKNAAGRVNRVFTTTMGAATDLTDASLRRLLVNATYWLTDLGVPARADVGLVGEYQPSAFGFDGFKKGVKPSDLAWKGQAQKGAAQSKQGCPKEIRD